jgi:hydroxymethylglutaryl-CoA lyase
MKHRAGVNIVEVGPRDGLQNLDVQVPVDDKVRLIERLAASGLREIQIGAFVSPSAIPQFRDMKEVAARVRDLPGITLTALVPNLRGAEAAFESGLRKLIFFFSISRSHNLNNVQQTPEASLEALASIMEAFSSRKDTSVCVALATVFGCPFEGFFPTDIVLRQVAAVADRGVEEVTLCDTVGFGNPAQVADITRACREEFPNLTFGVHLHDTRGLGLANALKAYEQGIRVFDAAVGGLGGCPFAPGASGNIATEDIVFMFGQMGIETGVRLEELLGTVRFLQDMLPGTPLTSAMFHAGPPRRADGKGFPPFGIRP